MKKKQSENYLEYVPQRTPETEFSEDETGIVTLTKEWTGVYNRIAQRFFKVLVYEHTVIRRLREGCDVSGGRILFQRRGLDR